MPSNQPIVLLRDAETEKFLPIWIGAVEATAIAFAQQGVQSERPLTHDLLRDVIESMGRTLTRVDITELRDGIFFAELVFDNGVVVSARPSDAIALALRTAAPCSPRSRCSRRPGSRCRPKRKRLRPKSRHFGSSSTRSRRRISKAEATND